MTIDDVLDSGLTLIHGLTNVTGPKADAALAVIALVVSALKDGLAGKTSPEIVQADLDSLIKKVSDDDANIDAEATRRLEKRFEDQIK